MNEQRTPPAMTVPSAFEPIGAFALEPLAIPDHALRHAATLVIDTLGVAAGAKRLEVGRIARDFAVEFHGAGSAWSAAPMLFDGRRVSLPGAAWALATQIDNLDAHDGFNPVKGHIGCAVIPALFAFAERHPRLTMGEALEAVVMAYELAARAGCTLHGTVTDYHTSGAWNALGVAALGARLEGFGQTQLRHALGIAEYHGPRSQMMREIDNPTMLHDGSGMGALVGCTAALLAVRGFTGAPAITVEGADAAQFWADLGERWTVAENYIKPYPTCRWGHAAIDAVRQIIEAHDLRHDEIAQVEINTFDAAARLFDRMPETTTQAQYSMHFALACMLCHGEIAPRHIEGEGLRDRAVAALIPKIAVRASDMHNARFPEGRWSDATIVLNDGRRLASGDVVASGGPGAWRPDADIEAKFHTFCEGILCSERAKAIWAMRDAFLDTPDRPLVHLTALITQPEDA